MQRRYDYGRPWRVAKRARKATREQLLTFYDRFIVPGAPEGRRLATHYFAKSAAPSILTVDEVPPELYPQPPERPISGERPSGVF